MRVSIIVPVYNVSDYVERCLNSVMAQTYTDLECIIVDDCTPDDSIEKCERMIAKYNGPIEFKILHHEHNRGLSAARNTGTDAATGEYIYYLDSDDEITSKCIEVLEKEVEKHPEVEMVMGNNQAIPYKVNFDKPIFDKPGFVDSNDWVRYNFFRYGWTFPVMAWNKLLKRSFLEKNGFLFKEGLVHEDELWIFFVIKKLQKISIVNDVTYFYYMRNNSIMSRTSKKLSAKHFGIILDEISCNMDQPFYSLQLYRYLCNYMSFFRYGYTSWNYWKVMPRFMSGLIKEGKRKFAAMFFLYVVFYFFHHGKGLERRMGKRVESLWKAKSIEVSKKFK